ncbi:hypothetical protein [Streptomyces sp. NPDC088348]|uniref:hypothetical protein n=1 Tax=Streptomyces sp. NPDC088348 TaxID=3365853 RepID=UPI0038079CB2
MKKPRKPQPELTPAERALLADPGEPRGGYMPHDGIPEPAQGPSEPAAVSAVPGTPVRETPEAPAEE